MEEKTWILELIARRKENRGVVKGHKSNYVVTKIVNSDDLDYLQDDILYLVNKAKFYYKDFNDMIWRVYITVDSRNIAKANKMLVDEIWNKKFYMNEDVKVMKIYKSLLANKKCRNERYFLLDIDNDNIDYFNEILELLKSNKVDIVKTNKTPNGFHVVSVGFNPKIIGKFSDVEIKHNALFFLKLLEV